MRAAYASDGRVINLEKKRYGTVRLRLSLNHLATSDCGKFDIGLFSH